MKLVHILSVAVCCWVGAPEIKAEQEAAVAKAPEGAVQEAEESKPFLADVLYPAWSELSPARALRDTRTAIAMARAKQAQIREIKPEDATYANVFSAYEDMCSELERVESRLSILSSVMDNEELRAVQEELIPELSAFASEITADEKLWHVIKAAAAAPWVKELSPDKQRFISQIVDSFRDSGADLSPEQKKRLAEINRELSTLTHQFGKNVLDSTNAWEWVVEDPALLEGMGDDWLARAAHDAQKKGYGTAEKPVWRITLDETSAREALYYCKVESTRKKCWEAITGVCSEAPYDNAPIVARVIELRIELAKLLGFKTFADLKLAHRMAGSGERAMSFVDEMMQKVKPAYDAEVQQLMDYIAAERGEKSDTLNPWDTPYYLRKLSKERYSFDPETLRPYQECNHVLRGMFSIAQGLYGISIKELPTACISPGQPLPPGAVEVWHPDVRLFAVYDSKTNAHLGSFYLDIFPRPSKRAGAWVMPMHYGTPAQGDTPHTPHLALLAGNLSAPTADKPALFSHYDVETLFHEFGHMLHTMLGDTELRSHCGTSVAWDFVELPSQMNENWTWEPLGVATYAIHYQTGEPIPADVVEKMNQSRFFFPAQEDMGQLRIAKLDMEIHTNYDTKFRGKDLDAATNALLAPWKAPSNVNAPSLMRNLTHCITGGYAAGYYSYKWAEVLAADVFTRFQREGIMNAETGAEYRRTILSKGDSKPAAELYRDFMGRDPNPNALLIKHGLISIDQ